MGFPFFVENLDKCTYFFFYDASCISKTGIVC